MSIVFSILTAFLISFLITPVLILLLKKSNIGSDIPGGRRIHTKVIPSLGGISFVVASGITVLIWAWLFSYPDIRAMLGGIILMFVIGLRDDLVEMKASQKLIGQLLSVIIVVGFGDVRIQDFGGFLGLNELPLWFSYLFTGFTLLALTNAFNLIDGLDGLAGTISMISFTFLGIWFYQNDFVSLSLLSFSFLGGIIGFLYYNWHPAKIFMGDTGSLSIGFTLGVLIISLVNLNANLPETSFLQFKNPFSIAAALMIFPLFDMGRVFIKRILKGKGPMSPDKSHVHHFLLRIGMGHDKVSFMLGGIQFCFIVFVCLMNGFSDNLILPVISGAAIFLGIRLDSITLKKLKMQVRSRPNLLLAKAPKKQKPKIEIDREQFQDSTINMN
jgi:UDP-N-acetylmuramyl pentapeptide phosphotransferase/UDP-N-acetylglucosamine-1-phosphate transferase